MPLTLQARAQALNLTVEESLRGVLALGLLEADGLEMEPVPPDFERERDERVARLSAQYAGRAPADIPGVAETRALFHQLDIDPTKTRPSSEALLRRVLQGKGLPHINLAVDVCNLSSLEHQIPLGLYDRDLVQGAVRVRIGHEAEGYPGIRKQRVNLAGRLLLADDEGPFGAPTSDSARTAVSARTKRLLVVLFCPAERADRQLSVTLEHLANLLTRFCSASVSTVQVVN